LFLFFVSQEREFKGSGAAFKSADARLKATTSRLRFKEPNGRSKATMSRSNSPYETPKSSHLLHIETADRSFERAQHS
jgi:hypothetical protein